MKITVITGSPHRNGTSALLADEFIRGASEGAHDIFRFDAAFSNVHPCRACEACAMGRQKCVFRDDMDVLEPHLRADDVIAFVTPLYYYGMSAQIKTVIDRFHGSGMNLEKRPKKAVFMATAYNPAPWAMDDIVGHYRTIIRYLGWEDAGTVLAVGCGVRADIERTDFPKKAYVLGKSFS